MNKQVCVGIITFFLAVSVWGSSHVRLQSTTFDPQKMSIAKSDLEVTKSWIVSFAQPVSERQKEELKTKGFEILGFIPDASLLVRGENPIEVSNQIAWTPFQPAWKWSPALPSPSVFNQLAFRVVMIRCHSTQDAQKLVKILEAKNKVFVLNITDSYVVVRANYSDLYSISAFDEVAFLSDLPEFQLLNMDLGITSQSSASEITGFETGTKVMNFENAWTLGFKGQGQIVAMGDTGLDRGNTQQLHSDFQGTIVNGRNFAPFGRSWEDPMGHGTHVAGSIMSRGAASGGAFKGGAHEAGLIVHSLWSPMMNNLMVPTKLSDMFQAALQSGASVHTNSWGQAKNFGGYDSFARQVDEFSFNNPDLLVMFAAGNSGVDMNKDGRIDADSIGSPGTAKNTLTVGASENYELSGGIQRKVSELRAAKDIWSTEPIWSSKISDNAQGIAMFSSRGPTDDGRIKPEIVAPGTNILSALSHHPKTQELWGKYNDEYVWSGGTSMATPLVAGAAAVTRQILQKNFGQEKPSSSLMKAFLMTFATDLYPGQYGEGGASRGQEILTKRPNNDEGFGLVNMKAQVEATSATTKVIDQKTGVATGEAYETEVQMPTEGALVVTLVWNDAPGVEASAKSLVNDLNLEVSGNGIQYSSNDSVNNFEFFEKSALPGVYKVKVIGRQVAVGKAGKQPFSLVIRTR